MPGFNTIMWQGFNPGRTHLIYLSEYS